MVPTLFRNNFFDGFDDLFDFAYPSVDRKLYGNRADRMMKTDVREKEGGYELLIDLPGFKKDEIRAELKDGYLTVSAQKAVEENEKSEEGTFIRRERYSGAMSRSFYVGKEVGQEDIKAKFEDGVLALTVPKIDEQKKIEQRAITIE